jgi:hypothetical protein
MTYGEAERLLSGGRLRFGDEKQIEAVRTVAAISELRDESKRSWAVSFSLEWMTADDAEMLTARLRGVAKA